MIVLGIDDTDGDVNEEFSPSLLVFSESNAAVDVVVWLVNCAIAILFLIMSVLVIDWLVFMDRSTKTIKDGNKTR